ncbi:MAG: hypothetical protein RLZ65_865 [Actinomycetota bacterium]
MADVFEIGGGLARVRDSLWPIAHITFAATLAYLVAHFALGHEVPLLAVTVAISSLGFVRDARPDRVAATALAMTLGVGLSETLLIVFGAGAVQLLVAILLSLILARFVSANPAFAITATLQAVLVQLLQAPSGGVYSRVIDGVIGGVIALAFTALIPRNPLKLARADAGRLFGVFKSTLGDLRSVLLAPNIELADAALERIRATQPLLDKWRSSLESAVSIGKISPFYRWAKQQIADQETLLEGMDLATRNLRVVVRRVDFLVRDLRPRPELASLIAKFLISVDLLESSLDDFSLTQKARKYLIKLAPKLGVVEGLGLQDQVIVMQLRPLFVDLCQASGMKAEEAKNLLPVVD